MESRNKKKHSFFLSISFTECYILIQGNTVSAMGPYKGIKQVRSVVTDCMKNIHPVYNIKKLMIMRELAKDPQLANEDWSRFLPNFKRKNVNTPSKKSSIHSKGKEKGKKDNSDPEKTTPLSPAAVLQQQQQQPPTAAVTSKDMSPINNNNKNSTKKKKKVYTPFPPPQTPSKIDLQLESGEYFLSERERKVRKMAEKQAKSKVHSLEKRAEKEKVYDPSQIHNSTLANNKNKKRSATSTTQQTSSSLLEDAHKLKDSLVSKQKKQKLNSSSMHEGVRDYLVTR